MVQAVEHQHARAVGLSIVAQIVSGALLGWGLYLTVAIGLALVYVTVSAARSINCSREQGRFLALGLKGANLAAGGVRSPPLLNGATRLTQPLVGKLLALHAWYLKRSVQLLRGTVQ